MFSGTRQVCETVVESAVPTDDEIKRIEDSADELARGYSDLLELVGKLAKQASAMGADARMLALRAKALRADLTPTRPPSVSALAASRVERKP